MSDEAEDKEIELELDASDLLASEQFEWSSPNGNDGGCVIFPHGVGKFATVNNVALVRISDKTGDVEYLEKLGSRWKKVTTSPSTSLHAVEASTDS